MKPLSHDGILALEDRYQLKTYRKLPIAIERGEGSWIWDTDGRKYLDFYGGHCVTLLGHRHPAVVQAVKDQADKILFYSNLVYSDVRAQAAEQLTLLAPEGLDTVFFCNSGTEANETALKLARKHTGRDRIIAFKGDFHGRTLGSLATTWNPKYRAPYLSVLPETHFVAFNDMSELTSAFGSGEAPAAVLIEPIQSIAGMVMASNPFIKALRTMCDEHGTVLIFDEVQTGVGRTGTFSVSGHYGVRPDLITLAKSLGSGLPVGAVLIDDGIADGVSYGDQGTTFGGGMLAMASVLATLRALQRDGLMSRATAIQNRIEEGVDGLGIQVRGKGCLLGLAMPTEAAPIVEDLRHNGVLAGGSSDPSVIRLMPPLTTTDEEIAFFLDVLNKVLQPRGFKTLQENG